MVGKIYALLFVIAFALFSCSDESDWESVTMGNNFISPQTHVVVVDTLSLNLSTIILDSVRTNSPANLLVGNYFDEYFGRVSSTSYFQMNIPTDGDGNIIDFDDDDAIFDSLTLVLQYSGLAFGDTTVQQTINVHEVSEDITEYDDGYLYNTSKFKYFETPLGSVSVIPRPNKDEELEIRLSDDIGKTLLQMMKDEDDNVSSFSKFLDYFKGIALVPGNEDASILAFESTDSLIDLVLHTHNYGQTKKESKYKFQMYSSTTCFNNIQSGREGTYLENLTDRKTNLSSKEMDDKSYIQGGTGVLTRLHFTGLDRILKLEVNNILYKAELILKPYPNSNEQVSYPERLMLYTTDKYNRLVSEVLNDDEETLIADFYRGDIYGEDIYYTFDITDVIIAELNDGYFHEENGLIISLPENTLLSTTERLVIDARKNNIYRPMLRLYFVYYE